MLVAYLKKNKQTDNLDEHDNLKTVFMKNCIQSQYVKNKFQFIINCLQLRDGFYKNNSLYEIHKINL